MLTYLNTKASLWIGLIDNSGPIQVELMLQPVVILLNTKHTKKCTLTLKVVNETVTNTLHGTNFHTSNSRNRLI